MSLELVGLKNNILNDVKRYEVKSKIISRIAQLNLNQPQYKNDNEFLLLVCNLAEFLIVKKDKVDKQELVVEIFNDLFALNEDEKELLKRNINFIHSNKQIKKVSYFKLFICGVKEFFLKKR